MWPKDTFWEIQNIKPDLQHEQEIVFLNSCRIRISNMKDQSNQNSGRLLKRVSHSLPLSPPRPWAEGKRDIMQKDTNCELILLGKGKWLPRSPPFGFFSFECCFRLVQAQECLSDFAKIIEIWNVQNIIIESLRLKKTSKMLESHN